MRVPVELIKKLRDETGLSVMQCREALEESGGDINRAASILELKASSVAGQKQSRSLGASTIAAYIHRSGTLGAIVELSAETDFVAKNEEFRSLAYDIAMHVAAMNPQYLRPDDVSEEALAKLQRDIADEASSSSANLRERAVGEKTGVYLDERTLIRQPFIKDTSITIGDLISRAVQKFGERIEVRRFARYQALE